MVARSTIVGCHGNRNLRWRNCKCKIYEIWIKKKFVAKIIISKMFRWIKFVSGLSSLPAIGTVQMYSVLEEMFHSRRCFWVLNKLLLRFKYNALSFKVESWCRQVEEPRRGSYGHSSLHSPSKSCPRNGIRIRTTYL